MRVGRLCASLCLFSELPNCKLYEHFLGLFRRSTILAHCRLRMVETLTGPEEEPLSLTFGLM
jgi:hypothetical protein